MKSPKKKYHLHYRGDFSLLDMDFTLNNTAYLDIDYIFLYTPTPICFSGYLTKKGLEQIRTLGAKNILHNKAWQSVFIKSKQVFRYIDLLNKKTIPDIESKHFVEFWKQIKKYNELIIDSYIYCEQPTLATLEKQADNKQVYHKLEFIGRHKLSAHRRLSILQLIVHNIILQYSKKYNLAVKDIEMMTSGEFSNFINNQKKTLASAIKKRKNGFVWHQKNGRWIIETGDNYKKWVKILLPTKKQKSVNGIATYAAQKPIVGKAKLHLSFSKPTNIAKGEILVTGMTNPQLIPVIKNAAAIVTDEGGIMCHAAIISRELKIPCIVGTQDATQIFKDGDLIKVDTQTGTITKLS